MGWRAGVAQQVHQQSNLIIYVLLEFIYSLINVVCKFLFHPFHVLRENLFQVGANRLFSHSKNTFKNNNVTIISNIAAKQPNYATSSQHTALCVTCKHTIHLDNSVQGPRLRSELTCSLLDTQQLRATC